MATLWIESPRIMWPSDPSCGLLKTCNLPGWAKIYWILNCTATPKKSGKQECSSFILDQGWSRTRARMKLWTSSLRATYFVPSYHRLQQALCCREPRLTKLNTPNYHPSHKINPSPKELISWTKNSTSFSSMLESYPCRSHRPPLKNWRSLEQRPIERIWSARIRFLDSDCIGPLSLTIDIIVSSMNLPNRRNEISKYML